MFCISRCSEQDASKKKCKTLKWKNTLVCPMKALFQSLKWSYAYEHFFTVSLCNKSRVQQRKTKVMWTDNILMGGIKDCKWSMEAAAKWWLWCGHPQRDAGDNALFQGHAEWQTLPSLSRSHTHCRLTSLHLLLNLLTLRLFGSDACQRPALHSSTPMSHQHISLSASFSPSSSHIN